MRTVLSRPPFALNAYISVTHWPERLYSARCRACRRFFCDYRAEHGKTYRRPAVRRISIIKQPQFSSTCWKECLPACPANYTAYREFEAVALAVQLETATLSDLFGTIQTDHHDCVFQIVLAAGHTGIIFQLKVLRNAIEHPFTSRTLTASCRLVLLKDRLTNHKNAQLQSFKSLMSKPSVAQPTAAYKVYPWNSNWTICVYAFCKCQICPGLQGTVCCWQ